MILASFLRSCFCFNIGCGWFGSNQCLESFFYLL